MTDTSLHSDAELMHYYDIIRDGYLNKQISTQADKTKDFYIMEIKNPLAKNAVSKFLENLDIKFQVNETNGNLILEKEDYKKYAEIYKNTSIQLSIDEDTSRTVMSLDYGNYAGEEKHVSIQEHSILEGIPRTGQNSYERREPKGMMTLTEREKANDRFADLVENGVTR